MRVLISAAGLIAAVTFANAADMVSPRVTKAPPVAPISSWTGFYFGANLGGGWAHDSYSGVTDGTSNGVPFAEQTIGSASGGAGSRDLSGVLGGGQIGFNYEFAPRWVGGVEADIDAANITGSNIDCSFSAGVVQGCSNANSKSDTLGTVRGRLGYAIDNVLLYGTGGFAWSHGSGTSAPLCFGAGCPGTSAAAIVASPVSFSGTSSGWAAGAGAEWRFLPNWSFRVEYLHLQFDGVATTGAGTETIGATPVAYTFRTTTNTGMDVIRVGLNWLFH